MEHQFRFEELKVYQKPVDYIDFVYNITQSFSKFETYELASQFRRASNSIALNIGEGEGGTPKEFANFLRISRRSVRECVVCTTLASRRNYLTPEQVENSRKTLSEISRMTTGLIKSLNI